MGGKEINICNLKLDAAGGGSNNFSNQNNLQVFGPSDAVEFAHKRLQVNILTAYMSCIIWLLGYVVIMIVNFIQDGLSAKSVSRQLVKEAVRERRCKDNCTALVIIFKHN